MNRLVTAIIGVISAPLVLASNANLCQVNEQVIFSCPTNKNKIISLCASRNLSAEQGYIQYRFGTMRATEMQYPSVKLLPAQAFKGRTQVFSGGGGTYLRFQNDDYDYIIYTGTGKGHVVQGVILLKNAEFKSYIACKSNPESQLSSQLLTDLNIASDNDNSQFFPNDIPTTQLAGSNLTSSSTGELSAIKQCYSNASTTVAISHCSDMEYGYYDKEMNKTYQQLLSVLDKDGQQALIDAQKAWLLYRNKECSLISLGNKGGTLQPVNVVGCYTTFNQKRIGEFENYIKTFKH